MPDWITLAIEVVGLAIMLLWIAIPIREFREIARVIRRKHARNDAAAATADPPAATKRPGTEGPRP